MKFISKNLKDTAQIAANFASSLKDAHQGATIIGLYGELGSGKTTFIKYLAENFGVKETIQSPTFVIMKSFHLSTCPTLSFRRVFPSFNKLIHIDAYRIEKPEEMLNLGWREIISDPQNLICIEWPERIAKIMPEHIMVKFEHVSENERKISVA